MRAIPNTDSSTGMNITAREHGMKMQSNRHTLYFGHAFACSWRSSRPSIGHDHHGPWTLTEIVEKGAAQMAGSSCESISFGSGCGY